MGNEAQDLRDISRSKKTGDTWVHSALKKCIYI